MTTHLFKAFKSLQSKTLLDEIQFQRSKYYYFLGKIDLWNQTDTPPVTTIDDSNETIRNSLATMALAKRILPNEVSLVVPRINWTTGTVYSRWDSTIDMTLPENQNFYVLTDDGLNKNVYKCIDNNNGVASTVLPTGSSFGVFQTSDGYKWKYMYTIPVIKEEQFLTAEYMPVQNALSDSFYNNGEITGLQIVDEGNQYTYSPTTILNLSGGTTTGAGATLGVTVNLDGTIASIDVLTQGSGYTNGAQITISRNSIPSGSSTNASALPVFGKVNTLVTITEPGSGYTAVPVVTISAPDDVNGVTAEAVATLVDGSVSEITITNQGSGYTTVPTISIDPPALGVQATASVTITADVLAKVHLVTPGTNYTESATATVDIGAGVLTPVINDEGSIISVLIENVGAGWVTPPNIAVSGVGTGKYGNPTAVLSCQVYQGEIANVSIEDPGINYSSDFSTNITITGDGTGAKAVPVIQNGKIIDAILTDPGQTYTYAIVTVNSTTGSGAKINSIIGISELESLQSVVEQTAIKGGIHAIKLTEGGSGYGGNTTVEIVGNGAGATAEAIVSVDGSIENIIITDPGAGYTYANVVITGNGVGQVNATAQAILPPIGGHGSNAISELFANKIMFSSVIARNAVFEVIDQEYRNYGIIKNPRDLFTNTFVTKNYATSLWKCVFDNQENELGELVIDEILTHEPTSNKFIVAGTELASNIVYLLPIDNDGIVPTGGMLSEEGVLGARAYNCLQIISSPTINKYSGELLVISRQTNFEFTDTQSVRLQTIIQF